MNPRTRSHRVLAPWLSLAVALLVSGAGAGPASPEIAPIVFNDNLVAAGTPAHGTLRLSLVAQAGRWEPFGPGYSSIPMFVFGEIGKPLQDPGPMIRVPVGTTIRATIHNLTGLVLVVHGLASRRGHAMDTLVVAPGTTGEAQFVADAEGTFYYWASAHGETFNRRNFDDAHLTGALIVDPPGAPAHADRVFVIEGNAADTTPTGLSNIYHSLFTFNGRAWPNTERLTYDVGDSVHWRIINASNDVHPLHLHGFFYRIDARGDLAGDTIYAPRDRRAAVTEVMLSGTTMAMAWHPDRPGAWIFHCHLNPHVAPNTGLGPDTEPSNVRSKEFFGGSPDVMGANHAMTGMGGLVLGLYVRAPAGWQPYTGARRTLRLLVQSDSAPGDTTRHFGYVLQDGAHPPAADSIRVPGTPIVLRRGEPVRIWVVNHTPQMTAVHWHGMELESPYDGVAGLSGVHPSIEAPIMPGDSFAALMTPPRAGTFIYHTHIDDIYQQINGLYGPLIVLDSARRWNPDTDRVFLMSDAGLQVALNGAHTPLPVTLTTGVRYRMRVINITALNPFLSVTLTHNGALVPWHFVAKDGAALPPAQAVTVDAAQRVSIGETYDYEVQRADTGTLVFSVLRANGTVVLSQLLHFASPVH